MDNGTASFLFITALMIYGNIKRADNARPYQDFPLIKILAVGRSWKGSKVRPRNLYLHYFNQPVIGNGQGKIGTDSQILSNFPKKVE